MSKRVGKTKLIFGGMIVLGLLIGLGAVIAVNRSKTAKPKDVNISITDNGFDPSSVLVAKGSNVIWHNNSTAPKVVAADSNSQGQGSSSIKSEAMGPGDTFTYNFSQSGTFNYHDDLNQSLGGQVIVK